jgi:cell division protein FtsQ
VDRVAASKSRGRTTKPRAASRRKPARRGKSNARRKSTMMRLRSLPWKIIAVVAFILSTGFGGGYYWVSGRAAILITDVQDAFVAASVQAGLTVQEVYVVGRDEAPTEMLLAALGIERGDPILLVDPAAAKARLEDLGWVAAAAVERHLPDTVYVRLRERRPLAIWQSDRVLKLVDTAGAVIVGGDVSKHPNLPHIVGPGAPSRLPVLLRALVTQPALARRLTVAAWVGERRWDLRFGDRIDVALPEGPVGPSLERLMAMQHGDGVLDGDIVSLDLRQDDRAVVRLGPDAVERERNTNEQAAGGSDA